jgi:hypothetical protein
MQNLSAKKETRMVPIKRTILSAILIAHFGFCSMLPAEADETTSMAVCKNQQPNIDRDAVIQGCTEVINATDETPERRAYALTRRELEIFTERFRSGDS